MNLRDYAKGQECQCRLPGVCNFRSDTTVLAHLRMPGITGAGQKAPDELGAWCCSSCHDEIDRRSITLETDFVRMCFYEAIFRTQYQLIKQGKIK